MIFRLKAAVGACALAVWSMCGAAWAESRLALVIGNSAYQAVPALPNPVNDARAMTEFLTRAGFDVTTATDQSQSALRAAIGDFAARVGRAGTGTVALVYYAGHGVQIDGENFLVPVDARIQRETDVPLQALRLTDVMNTLASVPSRMRIVLLDACRNNPFSEINKTAGRGLAIVDAPAGSIVSYATSPGAEAEDGTGQNSPYTSALLKIAEEPGLSIEQAFKRTRLSVNLATSGRQTPWESSSLSSEFSFFPRGGVVPAAVPPAAVPPAAVPPAAVPPAAVPPAAAPPAAAKPVAPAKTVEIWRRDLHGKTAEAAYEIVVLEDTVEAYEAYVSLFAMPPLGPRVRTLLDRRNEMIAWYIAVIIDTPASYQTFLDRYASSDFAATAMRLLDRARSRSLMASLGPGLGPAQLASLPAAPACACPAPAPARKGKPPRRVAAPPPPVVYYPPPVRVVPMPGPYVRPPPYRPPPSRIPPPPPPRGSYPPNMR